MSRASPSPALYALAKTSLFLVDAVQFLLTTVQFVLFLVDWALASAEQGLAPLRFYLALFEERERYAPEEMQMMERQLMAYRMVRWWRKSMLYGEPYLGGWNGRWEATGFGERAERADFVCFGAGFVSQCRPGWCMGAPGRVRS